jgi:hypothetical protein
MVEGTKKFNTPSLKGVLRGLGVLQSGTAHQYASSYNDKKGSLP